MALPTPVMHYAIKSNNVDFLTTYQPSLRGRVDVVYLDPPRKGEKQSHTQWVKKVSEVVNLVKPTLTKTGVIVASVKDVELARFRLLLDDVFGEKNFIGLVTIDTGNVQNSARLLSSTQEYLLLYARNMVELTKARTRWRMKREGLDVLRKEEARLRKLHDQDYATITQELKAWLKAQPLSARLKKFYNADERGLYTYSDLSAPKSGAYYNAVNPNTGQTVAIPSRGWGVSETTFQELVDNDEIIWGSTDDHQPLKKHYLKDTPDQVLRSILSAPQRSPEKLLTKLIGPGFSSYEPKDLDYIKFILGLLSPQDAVILDVYGGSGTTGHAVLDLNYEDTNSVRQFILVTWDEDGTYSQILKPRLEAVISGKWYDRQHRSRKATLITDADQIRL